MIPEDHDLQIDELSLGALLRRKKIAPAGLEPGVVRPQPRFGKSLPPRLERNAKALCSKLNAIVGVIQYCQIRPSNLHKNRQFGIGRIGMQLLGLQ